MLRKHLLSCDSAVKTQVHEGGTYVCMEGPAFSTRAESEMHRQWGGTLIGIAMTPTTDATVVIDNFHIATYDTAHFVVNSTPGTP